MNRNPLLTLLALLIALWLVFALLRVAVGVFGVISALIVLAYLASPRFRASVQDFFDKLFNR